SDGVLSIVDQCLFTGTNFVSAVIVGRFAGTEQFACYTLWFSLVMLAIAFQRSFFVSSYVVLCRRFRAQRQAQLRYSMLLALACMIAGILIIGETISFSLGDPFPLVVPIAIAAGLLRDFIRRIAIADSNLVIAIVIDAVICVAQLLGFLVLAFGLPDSFSAASSLGWAALVWGVVGSMAILLNRHPFQQNRFTLFYWRYLSRIGRWISYGQVLSTLQSYLLPWLLAAFHSLSLAGVYAACWTLVQIMSPIVEGVGNTIGPALARHASQRAWHAFCDVVRTRTCFFALLAAGIAPLMFFGGRFAMLGLYGTEYASHFNVLMLLTVAVVIRNLGIPCSKALTQLHLAHINVVITGINLLTFVFAVPMLLFFMGSEGAAWGILLACIVSTPLRCGIALHQMNQLVHGDRQCKSNRQTRISRQSNGDRSSNGQMRQCSPDLEPAGTSS
ncbi:MAG: lipopolysaccharide biosynthesis protein, partial [Planctomycetota bacterium]